MKVARIWASADGESHVEEFPAEMAEAEAPGLVQGLVREATLVRVRQFDPGFVTPWHPARSAATFATWISGSVLVDVSDGTTVRLAEDGYRCMLFEDRTGRGHRFRVDPETGVTFTLVTLAEG